MNDRADILANRGGAGESCSVGRWANSGDGGGGGGGGGGSADSGGERHFEAYVGEGAGGYAGGRTRKLTARDQDVTVVWSDGERSERKARMVRSLEFSIHD